MLDTRFRGNWPAGSGEDFSRVSTLYIYKGVAAILVM